MLSPVEADFLRTAEENGFLLTVIERKQRGDYFRQVVSYWEKYCREKKVPDIRIARGEKTAALRYSLAYAPWRLLDSGVNELRNAVVRIDGDLGVQAWNEIEKDKGEIVGIPTGKLDKVLAEVRRVFQSYRLPIE